MKAQILFIHGGDSFSNYDDFLESLKTEPIRDPLGTEVKKRWKETLKLEFGQEIDVFYPSMPNKDNARYTEWKIWFERYFEYLNGNVILIGHSQGGYFLAKYLSENTVPFPILALYLVAAPFGPGERGAEDGGDFVFNPENLKNIYKVAQNITIYHSEDDEVVPFSHALSYHETLPKAAFITFKDRGHFLQPEFPEIIEDIKLRI